jgi:DNA-binding transcriptional regulator GbsR (MarR family)
MALSEPEKAFVLHWGEMGSRWGVNRSVAQIHALLHLSGKPMTAEEIAETLSMARSNVSTSLRELLGWRLIETTHVLGDRRDHYTAVTDGLEMAKRIVEGRRQREFLPTLSALSSMVEAAKADTATPRQSVERMESTLGLMEQADAWYREMSGLSPKVQSGLLRMGARIAKLLPGREKD